MLMRRDQRSDDCGDEDADRRNAEAVRAPHDPEPQLPLNMVTAPGT
jgi:hypothetical protein